MNIAILVNELNIRGGTHKQVHRLANYLIDKGHNVRLFTKLFDSNLCYPGIENFSIRSYDKFFLKGKPINYISRKILNFKGYYRVAKDINAFADIVNIHDNGFFYTHYFLKKSNPKSKVVWQVNDLPHYFRLGNLQNSRAHVFDWIGRRNYTYAASISDVIIVNVAKNAERVKKYYNKEAYIVYCGVDLRCRALPEKKVRNKISIFSIGVFFPYRNYETLLEVLHVIKVNHNIDCEANIAGSIALAPEYAKKIDELIIKKEVDCKIWGDVSEDQLIALYQKSNFFVFLNIDQSWGLAVFEAMNMGLPVIVSESVGATELISDKDHAVIVNPIDVNQIARKIIELYTDSISYQLLVKNAFEYTLSMTWDNMYSQNVEKIFCKLLK